ncbi:Gfo/Idh/MocA family protein [Deinococcus ruber]|uniref:Oxidoreductase n=1 Tax=Deinococcus ruber TaxID=1848197 RepID=A0A918F8P0_9DEIO|nr:Gfo/Idh/MocA family oxidoreductase [Deinococcus ruber]GGR19512.1 oxidoreductase [Deinococcus ruber]
MPSPRMALTAPVSAPIAFTDCIPNSAGEAMTRRLRAGMVGGGPGAFIGAVHRQAMALTGQIELVAGAFASDAARSRATGQELGLSAQRGYASWEAMLEAEQRLPEDQRIELVVIVTPNHLHFPVARAFAQAGVHVVCDKPLVHTTAQAQELRRVVQVSGVLFGVTYNYTGYPMVRQAREMVRSGQLGDVRKVVVQYHQGWLATQLEREGNKQAGWRTDPVRSGVAGAVGDIGSHAENLLTTVTGLALEAICADLTTFVPGRALDDDASILLRFKGGAKGVLTASQIAVGQENDLSLQVYGTQGSLSWRQEDPNCLLYWPLSGGQQIWTRGSPQLSPAAQAATHLPAGHPEGFIDAFSNIYRGFAAALTARLERRVFDAETMAFPGLEEGIRGVRFIEKTVQSARSTERWTQVDQ